MMKPSRKEENGSCGRQTVNSELQVSFAIVRCMLYRTDLRGNQRIQAHHRLTSSSVTQCDLIRTIFKIFPVCSKK